MGAKTNNYNAYVNPLVERYASEEMSIVFSDREKFETWRKLWCELAKAQKALGLSISDEQIEELESHIHNLNLDGHVLLVEDFEANQMFVGIVLTNAGMTYETANNGLEAIEKFENGKYDIILMDENMPKLGGVEAAREILQIEKTRGLKHTPIISLTANALKGDRERFLNAGMDDYISKPVEPDNLLKTIKHFIS